MREQEQQGSVDDGASGLPDRAATGSASLRSSETEGPSPTHPSRASATRLELCDLKFRLLMSLPGGGLLYQDEATGAQCHIITVRGKGLVEYALEPATYDNRSPKVYHDENEFLDALEFRMKHMELLRSNASIRTAHRCCNPCRIYAVNPSRYI